MQDQGGWYEQKHCTWEVLQDLVIIAGTRPPTSTISQRCTRHMTTLYMPMPTEACMHQMFHPIIDSFFAQNYPADIQDVISRAAVTAAVEAHACIAQRMLPTPAIPQYQFNLHTLSTAIQVRELFSSARLCAHMTWAYALHTQDPTTLCAIIRGHLY